LFHQALIFDCDGVLADTERDGHRPSFNAAFTAKGIDCVWDVDLYGHLLETVSVVMESGMLFWLH
jgi:beta-phosphoglucomutase-like phosphatase (HAD superfamily)